MAHLQSYFTKFISNIEPDSEYKNDAIKAHNKLTDYLESSESSFASHITESLLYGSYKRYTAIHSINDVDICILTNLDAEDEEYHPKKVLRKLKKSISDYYKEVNGIGDNTDYSRKSILIKDALPDKTSSDLTLDVIPAIEQPDSDNFLVPDRYLEQWVETNVKAHSEATTKKNEKELGRFVPFVKLFKHWKKYNLSGKHPKGFWLEALLIEEFEYINNYAESFDNVLQKILDKFKGYNDFMGVPKIEDPGIEGETLKTKMSLNQFKTFMQKISSHKKKSAKALASDEENAKEIWMEVFGEDFPESIPSEELAVIKSYSLTTNQEEFINQDYSFNLDNQYKIQIKCQIIGHLVHNNANKNPTNKEKEFKFNNIRVGKKTKIKFDFDSYNLPSGSEVLWKVRNYGEEAKKCPRGEIGSYTNNNKKNNIEITTYVGTHIVECYAVKDKNVIAMDRFKVVIR